MQQSNEYGKQQHQKTEQNIKKIITNEGESSLALLSYSIFTSFVWIIFTSNNMTKKERKKKWKRKESFLCLCFVLIPLSFAIIIKWKTKWMNATGKMKNFIFALGQTWTYKFHFNRQNKTCHTIIVQFLINGCFKWWSFEKICLRNFQPNLACFSFKLRRYFEFYFNFWIIYIFFNMMHSSCRSYFTFFEIFCLCFRFFDLRENYIYRDVSEHHSLLVIYWPTRIKKKKKFLLKISRHLRALW